MIEIMKIMKMRVKIIVKMMVMMRVMMRVMIEMIMIMIEMIVMMVMTVMTVMMRMVMMRNKSHKYCCSPKSITTVNNDGGTLNIFEGWINYLSALVYFDVERLEGTTIVLNGLGLFYHIKDTLLQYQKINCFLDFGRGGDSVTDMIKSIIGVDKCHDHRYLHNEDEDFNDMLIRIKNNK